MSVNSLFTYTLFLALGIGAVTNAKALLIEQGPQEAAQIAKSYRPGGVRHRRYRMRPSFSHAPNQWHRWTV
mgnify:CR=1 FL=1